MRARARRPSRILAAAALILAVTATPVSASPVPDGPTPPPVPSPTAAPIVPLPATVVPGRNPALARVVAPGIVVASPLVARTTPLRVLIHPPGKWLSTAPHVTAVAGGPIAIGIEGAARLLHYDVRIRAVGRDYARLGIVDTWPDGTVGLPVVAVARTGWYRIAIVEPVYGTTDYIALHVLDAR